MTDKAVAPPGWPAEVRPPGAPDWERTAVVWLYDQCPPDYRAHEVLRRHPVVLARFAVGHLRAAVDAARAGLGTVRADLRDLVSPEALEGAVTAYEVEGARLVRSLRAAELVEEALRGRRFAQRL
jgi:hypothetical protein